MSIFFKFQSHCPFGQAKEEPSSNLVTLVSVAAIEKLSGPKESFPLASREEKEWDKTLLWFDLTDKSAVGANGFNEEGRNAVRVAFSSLAQRDPTSTTRLNVAMPGLMDNNTTLIMWGENSRTISAPVSQIEASLRKKGHQIIDLSIFQSSRYKHPAA